MADSGGQVPQPSNRRTFLSLPQELLDMIIKEVYMDTIVTIDQDKRSSKATAANRNGGLLLTCKTLKKHATIPYYKYSIFRSTHTRKLEAFLSGLSQRKVEARANITKLHCAMHLDLLQDFDTRTGQYFGAVFFGVRDHSKLMCLHDAAQRILNEFATRVCGAGYGIGVVTVSGSAEFYGYRVWGLRPHV